MTIHYHATPPRLFADKLDNGKLTPAELELMARRYSTRRVAELRLQPIHGDFDLNHLCKIHHYIFQDVSTLAGSVRQYGLKRIDHKGDRPFARPWEIEEIFSHNVARIVGKISNSTDSKYVISGCAHVFNAINHAHPFCDGNGRSAREFVETLANEQGWSFNLELASIQDKSSWYTISQAGRAGDYHELVEFFNRIAVPLGQTAQLAASPNIPNDTLPPENAPAQHAIYPSKENVYRYMTEINHPDATQAVSAQKTAKDYRPG